MVRDLPSVEQVLEELADKTTAQIDRVAPVAFDGALREMIRYHRFLLALNASRTAEGAPFNYAEVAGDAWHAPHKLWARQYRRLFERAANRIPDEAHFIRSLAYLPIRLLPGPGDPSLPPRIVETILDLQRTLIHMIEAWVTKRTTLENLSGESARPRLALAGSDAKAYANILPELIGAWEGLLRLAPSIYGWREDSQRDDSLQWSALSQAWPFLWRHLNNTAYCLAVAVWNEDEVGAASFREALVRWPQTLGGRLDDELELRHPSYLFPDIFKLDWLQARAIAASLEYEHMPAPTADRLFAATLRGAHDDVLLLTAELLLFWNVNEKQASNIGARTSQALLHRERDEEERRGVAAEDLSFRSLFLRLVRFELSPDGDGSYGADLDSLVVILDNMTERTVVPGRIFTPSTLNGRDELRVSILAMLASLAPEHDDDGVSNLITELARNEDILPEGDRSLRNVIHGMERVQVSLEQPTQSLIEAARLLKPERDPEFGLGRVREVAGLAKGIVEAERFQRLQERPIDHAKLERIRLSVEVALLNGPSEAPFFRDVEIGQAARDTSSEWRDMLFSGISKASLVDPPMEATVSAFEEMFVSGSQEMAGRHAWNAFKQRPRISVEVAATVENDTFWDEIASHIEQVGIAPVLVVSRPAEARALWRIRFRRDSSPSNLRVESRSLSTAGASYIATINGVDVFGANVEPGVAWLFSARALQRIRYTELETPSHYVDVAFELQDDRIGTLRLRFRPQFDWSDGPIFEIRTAASDAAGDDGDDDRDEAKVVENDSVT